MKPSKQIFDQANYTLKAYDRYKEIFRRFYTSAKLLTEQGTPVVGVVFKPALEENHFDVFFDGMRIRFLYLVNYGEGSTLAGNIVAVRVWPTFSENADIVASIAFDGEGFTRFEAAEGTDRINVEFKAAEIVMIVLDMALRKPLA